MHFGFESGGCSVLGLRLEGFRNESFMCSMCNPERCRDGDNGMTCKPNERKDE